MIDLDAVLTSMAFRNNPNLRPAGMVIEYDEWMLDELAKCKQDPIYFIKKYVKVIHVDRGMVPFELWPYQENMIRGYHENRKCLSLLFRQGGKTTTTAAFICWFALFHDDKISAIMANKELIAKEILAKIQLAYENLPKWMQSGVITWNKKSIELENGSRVIAAATSSSGLRGFSIALLYLDEFAHLADNVAEDFFTSVYPTLSSGTETKILISSTPKGRNLFYKFWDEGEKKINGFHTQRFDWWEHPERTQKWADEQRAILGELKFNQEILMHFLGSSMTLLGSETLSRLTHETPIKVYGDEYKGLRIYSPPQKGHTYTMTCDVSRGRHLDDSAFTVYDITTQPFTVAAVYNNNEVAPLMYANIIHKIAKNYNEAYVLVEINDIGGEVANSLYLDFEYDSQYWTKSGDTLGRKGADPYPGIRTTKKTKRIGCANVKDLIDRNNLIINDYETIEQFTRFTQNDTGSYAAETGAKDDLVMTHVLFGWLVTQPWFKLLTDQDARVTMYSEAISKIEEDLSPSLFIVNDGNEEVGGWVGEQIRAISEFNY